MATAQRMRVDTSKEVDENKAPLNFPAKLAHKNSKSVMTVTEAQESTANSRTRGRVTDALVIPGTVERIILGENNFSPVLQVLQVKRKSEIGLSLGDGERMVEAALSPNLTHFVTEGTVREHTLVRLKGFFCTTVENKAVLVLMDIEVCGSASAIAPISSDRMSLSSAPSGARSQEILPEPAKEPEADDEDLPRKLGRGRSFGQGSREWFDAPGVPQSLPKDIAKALQDGVDVEKILPELLAGKRYQNPNPDGQTWNSEWKELKDGPEDPAKKQTLNRAMSRDAVSAATQPAVRNAVGVPRKKQEKEESEDEAEPQHEEKKRGFLGRLFGLGKKKDEGVGSLNRSKSNAEVKPVTRSVSVGSVKKSKLKKATSSLNRSRSKTKMTVPRKAVAADDDDIAPPPEDEYPGTSRR